MTPALGFEKWVEVQGEEDSPSVCAQMGFGTSGNWRTGVDVD